jgi:hypothetical protein
MNLIRAYKLVRQLAKTDEYQSIYSYTKELHFKLFENLRDFSYIQLVFLKYLIFYSTLYMDIYLQEVDETVLKYEIYEEAYMFYKNNQKNKKEGSKYNSQPNIPIGSVEKFQKIQSQWKFKK